MHKKAGLFTTSLGLIFILTQCYTGRHAVTGDPTGRTPSAVREFRAAWVATVANINWPSERGLSVEEQKKEAIELLDLLHDNNFNAVIFQVRPQCDALYHSELEPWSYYLTGEQGKAPEPYYDPLEFWIDEAHKRGLELHAWLNPYRAHHSAGGPVSESSIVRKKADLVLYLERGYWWLDPALQGTQDHSYEVVMDLVRRYDLDGIHFDDYFYPYPDYNNFKDFPDDESWGKYLAEGGKLSRSDWRRDNVNKFIERVYKGIKAEKPYVKFGLSPFGIWKPYNPPFISGFDQHEVLYADARLWLNRGWVDYYTPQLYWPTGQLEQSFPVLLGWWSSENSKERHLWPGINIGRLSGDKAIDETINQIMITRGMLPESPGVVHWSIAPLVYNPMMAKALVEGPYEKEALVPPSPWLSKKIPEPPRVRYEKLGDSLSITWNQNNSEDIARWVVYKKYGSSWQYSVLGKGRDKVRLAAFKVDKDALLSMDPDSTYEPEEILTPLDSFAVSAVDRYGNESMIRERFGTGVSISEAPDPEKIRAAYIAGTSQEAGPEKPVFEIKEYIIPDEIISGRTAEKLKDGISQAVEEAKKKGANSVFLKVMDIDAGVSDALNYAAGTVHDNGMKIFFIITPLEGSDRVWDLPFPEIKTSAKDEVRRYTIGYNIDGLGFEFKGYRLNDSENKQNLLSDLLEDAVVEARIVKPYLQAVLIKNDSTVAPYGTEQAGPDNIVNLDFSDYFNGDAGGQEIYLSDEGRTKITDSEGSAGFIIEVRDTLRLETERGSLAIPTDRWSPPYDYAVMADGSVSRKKPWVEFRRMPETYTDKAEFDLLCKTDYPARVEINGEKVKQYKTGIFFNTIKFSEGANRVRATVFYDDSLSVFYENEFIYYPPEITADTDKIWIEASSVTPDYEVEVLKDDIIPVSFTGSPGKKANLVIIPGNFKVRCSVTDYEGYGAYRADVPLHMLEPGQRYSVLIQLSETDDPYGSDPYEVLSPLSLKVRPPYDFPLVRVTEENTRLTYNLGAPRLGGPLRSELDPGVIFKTSGRFGDYYRVQLSEVEHGFVHSNDVEILPDGIAQPSYYITSMSCGPSQEVDILTIPYLEPVPYEIHPDPEGRRIIISLYGVETSSTWISHYEGLKIIDRVTWEQSTPDNYRVLVNLKTNKIWGYDLKVQGKSLVLKLKYPPLVKPASGKPLSGLKIAIEAGHGGSSTGAVGLSGLLEKDINLDLSLRLGELCSKMGADVIQVRDSDVDMSLIEKRDRAISSGADMLISIHANAGGRGYLSVDGTSTYYHNPFWAPLAESIYNRLLELDLDEFGVVGSFNYTVTRTSRMPAVLVEQAFMSHAEDEEKLADPEFRQQIAKKIYQGIVDYLKYAGVSL